MIQPFVISVTHQSASNSSLIWTEKKKHMFTLLHHFPQNSETTHTMWSHPSRYWGHSWVNMNRIGVKMADEPCGAIAQWGTPCNIYHQHIAPKHGAVAKFWSHKGWRKITELCNTEVFEMQCDTSPFKIKALKSQWFYSGLIESTICVVSMATLESSEGELSVSNAA